MFLKEREQMHFSAIQQFFGRWEHFSRLKHAHNAKRVVLNYYYEYKHQSFIVYVDQLISKIAKRM